MSTNAASIMEIVLFRLNEGVNDAELLDLSASVQALLQRMSGYRSRELYKSDDGLWVDIVAWNSLNEALKAAEVITADPCAKKYDEITRDMSMMHLHLMHKYE